MRVCQFRHFGTGIASGANQIGSKFESRKSGAACQGNRLGLNFAGSMKKSPKIFRKILTLMKVSVNLR
jgi:hypothetical protein